MLLKGAVTSVVVGVSFLLQCTMIILLRWLTTVLMEYKSTTFNSFKKGSIYCLLKSFTILCEI